MRQRLALAVLALGLALPSSAQAIEVFASPDETRTTQDCLTEATACALGRAITVWDPPISGPPFPPTPPYGTQILTLLPGRYDNADRTAGGGSSSIFVPRGRVIQGKSGAERPVLAIGDPGFDRPVIDLGSGGIVRDLDIDATAQSGIDANGIDASISSTGESPAVIERVRVTSNARPSDDTSFGLRLEEVSRAVNVDIDHRAAKGAAISMSAIQTSFVAPRISGVTATSTSAVAVAVSAGFNSQPGTLRLGITNAVLRGATDLVAHSDFFSSAPPPGTPTPLELTLKNSAVRAASRTIGGPVAGSPGTPGTVTLIETGTVDTADLGLAADRVPTAGSPLINAGTADADLGATDLLGKARTVGPLPDIGAYEFATPPAPAPTPTPAAQQPARDIVGPVLAFTGKGKTLKRSKLSKGKGLAIPATTSEAFTTGKLDLLTRTKRKGKTTEKILASTPIKSGAAGPLALKLKAKASKLGKGKVKAILRLTLTDTAGNTTTLERAVTIS
jgi:hypothetical protein